ncbi:ubiquinone anaerobic biosynthesis protein UbiU [Marinobacterium arenosum]|uniref:ubiquinone anaerobic biosynthesis protein UbiU n=1 Tax=Marinobacterium arenosum TaxID=2862496 RepID=UPI001C987CAE|nr:peptidase U32 family protein [Marinobacterium arenosum]MBY4676093.1 U32 family peptidase [Marinobacterium arenosum]
MELVCPAGSFPALKAAVDNGAGAVYFGFRGATNARQFIGLNFDEAKAAKGIRYARDRGVRVLCAINTYPQPQGWAQWQRAVDMAADLGVDALIAADMGVLGYAAERHPSLALHLSVQGSATNYEALNYYQRQFGIKRAVLPRVLSLAQVEHVAKHSPVELEVFAFGSLCIMVEGRCYLSSYLTDESPNTCGACSPAKAVRWQETEQGLESRLNEVLIDRYGADEKAGYPTLCKGRFDVEGNLYHALEEPTSLNTLELIPQLRRIGIQAVKIEGRQRSPAYVAQVTRIWREALDAAARDPDNFQPQPAWNSSLSELSEGTTTTIGAYHRSWQ